MLTNPENARKLVNDLWQQAQGHIDEAKHVVTRSRDRLESRFHQLKGEPNRIIHKLGERVLQLSDENSQYVPEMFQVPVNRFNNLVASLLDLEAKKETKPATEVKLEAVPAAKVVAKVATKPAKKKVAKAASPAKKKAARKTTKTSKKKTTKKTAGAAKKKTKAAKTTRKKASKKTKRS